MPETHLAEVPRPGNTGVPTKAQQNKQLLKPSDGTWKIHSSEGEMAQLPKHCTRPCAGGGKCEAGPCGERSPSGSQLLPFSRARWQKRERDGTAARQGCDGVKGLRTETCGVSYSQRDRRGKRLILETSHFNQMQSRWGTRWTVSFLAFHVWVQRLLSGLHTVPQGARQNPGTDIPWSTEVWRGSLSWVGSPKPLQ